MRQVLIEAEKCIVEIAHEQRTSRVFATGLGINDSKRVLGTGSRQRDMTWESDSSRYP